MPSEDEKRSGETCLCCLKIIPDSDFKWRFRGNSICTICLSTAAESMMKLKVFEIRNDREKAAEFACQVVVRSDLVTSQESFIQLCEKILEFMTKNRKIVLRQPDVRQ